MKNNPTSTHGFTLLEMMVVIGILALLALVIVPVIQRAGATALKTQCISNVRQIGIALRSYTLKNSYHLPYCTRRPTSPPAGEEGYPGLSTVLAPFFDDHRVMKCPADDGSYFQGDGMSYEWNSLLNGKMVGREKLFIVDVEVEVPLLADYEAFHKSAGGTGKNYLYADGSVDSEFRQ